MNQLENKNNEKILNLIGLATRARKTSMGIDFVIGNIQHNKAKLVFIANDASIETIKKVLKRDNKVIVEGINIVHKHKKGNGQDAQNKLIFSAM